MLDAPSHHALQVCEWVTGIQVENEKMYMQLKLTGLKLRIALLANWAVIGWVENGRVKKVRVEDGGTFRQ